MLLTLASSVALPALVGALAGYWSQRFLMDRKARVDYEFNAKRRLYEVVGPLRFQMLMATRDVTRRLASHHETPQWNLGVDQYFGRSTMYRLLRPLAIAYLVEQRTSFADFSVDESGLDLIRFETASYRMLTGRDPLPYYDGIDWGSQTQHVFRDNLRQAAACLLDKDSDGRAYVIDYAEFAGSYPDPRDEPRLAPLANIIEKCNASLVENPVFWTRLLGYAYVCNWYMVRAGKVLGLTPRPNDLAAMLVATGDSQIIANADRYPRIFDQIIAEGI